MRSQYRALHRAVKNVKNVKRGRSKNDVIFLYTFPVLNAPGIGAIPSEFCNSDCLTRVNYRVMCLSDGERISTISLIVLKCHRQTDRQTASTQTVVRDKIDRYRARIHKLMRTHYMNRKNSGFRVQLLPKL